MTKPFKGVINVDIKESVPDWAPYTQPIAPPGAPNVLYVVLDDVGFSAMEPFGGLIETPNIDRIAQRGLTYTNFHTTALCSPTRSCLMTGRNHTTNGMATITEAASGFPSSNGHIPFECGTVAEVLGERGWNTYMTGKWHLTAEDEMNMWKRYSNWEGGTADPMIVSWPARITSSGLRRQYVHAIDIVPTLYSVLGIEPPEGVKGYTQFPLEGVSFEATFDDAEAKTDKQTQFYSMGGTRAIWHQGWKAAAISSSAPGNWAGYDRERGDRFNTGADPSECHDLSAEQPERLQELIGLWWHEAGRYQALPLENR